MSTEMQQDEAVNDDDAKQDLHNKSNGSEKKSKYLNKLLYKQIREQMEFYFSDSNLSKDRFLKQEISKSEDGCKL